MCWHIDVDGNGGKWFQSRQGSTPHVISLAHPKLKKQTQTVSNQVLGAIAVAIDLRVSYSIGFSQRK